MKLTELKEYAFQNGIDITGLTKKADIEDAIREQLETADEVDEEEETEFGEGEDEGGHMTAEYGEEEEEEESVLDFEMLGPSDNPAENYVNMLVYARSGAGKTYFAGTAPKPFIMAADPRGHDSVPQKIPGKIVSSLEEVNTIIEWFESGGHVDHGIRTLIVDGLNFIHDMFLTETGMYMHETMGAKDPDLMPIAGQMKILRSYKRMMLRFLNLNSTLPKENRVHVIFTALEMRIKEDDDAPFQIAPLLGTKSINEVFPALFSVIAYITPVGEDAEGNLTKDRKVLFTEYRGIMARDRLGIFPTMGQSFRIDEYIK